MGCLTLLAGCKGNTSAAAVIEKTVSPPPHIQAYEALKDPRFTDPLASTVWNNARWFSLSAPIGSERTTAPVSGAILFDASNLYIAFVSEKPNTDFTQDMVSVYLDSTAVCNGSEMMEVTVNATGEATCTWIRDINPPLKPKEDGNPDIVHPLSKIHGDNLITGLFTKTRTSTLNGAPVWSAVVAIPLNGLPLPLRNAALPGTHWKINLLRTTIVPDANAGLEQLQANLSPVYVGQQAVAPYRLADLELVNTQVSSAQ
jgi:hypothetical protein